MSFGKDINTKLYKFEQIMIFLCEVCIGNNANKPKILQPF